MSDCWVIVTLVGHCIQSVCLCLFHLSTNVFLHFVKIVINESTNLWIRLVYGSSMLIANTLSDKSFWVGLWWSSMNQGLTLSISLSSRLMLRFRRDFEMIVYLSFSISVMSVSWPSKLGRRDYCSNDVCLNNIS
jgi:hypothetical protein